MEKSPLKLLKLYFFIVHYILGYALLWLMYVAAQYSFYPMHGAPLALRAAVQTIYLVAGVIGGNIGWDVLKSMHGDVHPQKFIYIFVKTLYPVIPLLIAGQILFSLFYEGHFQSLTAVVTLLNCVVLGLGLIMFILHRYYRRSESWFVYRIWGI